MVGAAALDWAWDSVHGLEGFDFVVDVEDVTGISDGLTFGNHLSGAVSIGLWDTSGAWNISRGGGVVLDHDVLTFGIFLDMLIGIIDVETTGPVFTLLITSPEVAGEVVSWFGVAVESAGA